MVLVDGLHRRYHERGMNIAVKAVVGTLIAAIVLPGIGLAQSKPAEAPLKPVTVCEILASPQQFNGKDLAVLGRFSFTDEGWWLAEDGCGTKLVTEGYKWGNLIWLDCRHEAAPDPPSGFLVLDESRGSSLQNPPMSNCTLRVTHGDDV